jgi:hypothetical protein
MRQYRAESWRGRLITAELSFQYRFDAEWPIPQLVSVSLLLPAAPHMGLFCVVTVLRMVL